MALPDADYHREKYGLVALAGYLTSIEGWSRVLLTVIPGSLDDPEGPRGLVPPVIDAEQDRLGPHYGEIFYTDIGGRIDLVAVRSGQTLYVSGTTGSLL